MYLEQIEDISFLLGYKTHRDCLLNGLKQDRYATFLAYLNTVMNGGETEFPGSIFIFQNQCREREIFFSFCFCFEDLGIKIKPKEGRVVVWNNMNENGECEEKSIHSANIVEDEEEKYVLQRW